MTKGGVHLWGEIGELWLHGCKAGLLYRWRLQGWELDWELQAERYKLDPLLYREGRREIDLVLPQGPLVELRAKGGMIWNEVVADGKTHRAIVIRGRRELRSWRKQQEPVAQPSRST